MAEGLIAADEPAAARHPLHACLVRITTAGGAVVGSGFLVADRLVCTCAHVVAQAVGDESVAYTGSPPCDPVRVELYRGGASVAAVAIADGWRPVATAGGAAGDAPSQPVAEDVALLALADGFTVPGVCGPARLLAPPQLTGDPFTAFGFPGAADGVAAHGTLGQRRERGTVQLESDSGAGIPLQPGFSGAPVWDERRRGVVGMVVSTWTEAATRVAFMIAADVLAAGAAGRFTVQHPGGPFGALTDGLLGTRRGLEAFLVNYIGRPGRGAPFGGRERELAALDAWLAGGEPRYRVLCAAAGRGKSALLAHWALEVAESGRAHVALVPISARFGTSLRADAMALAIERLRWLLADARSLTDAELPFFLSGARGPGELPLLLVFDSLDEAVGWLPERELPVPLFPGDGVRVLASARVVGDRGGVAWRRALGWHDLAGVAALPALDVAGVADALERAGASSDEAQAKAVFAGSGGDPLLVGLAINAIRDAGPGSAGSPPPVDGDLSELFDRWWEDQRSAWTAAGRDPDRETERASRIFAALATALGPAGLDELAALTEIDSAAVLQGRLADLDRWVIGVAAGRGSERAYTFAHPRFGRFWHDEQMTAAEREKSEEAIVHFALAQLQALRDGADPAKASIYALRYLAAHLEQRGAGADELDALVDPAWWRARRALEGGDEGFLGDLDRAWRICEAEYASLAEDDRDRAGVLLGRQLRDMVMTCAVRGVATNIPAALLVRLVQSGQAQWSLAWAISQARHNSFAEEHAEALLRLAGCASDQEQRTALLDEALAAARAGSIGHVEARALAALGPERLPEALDAVRLVRSRRDKADVLVELAAQVPASLTATVLGTARELDDQTVARVVVALAPHLTAASTRPVLEAVVSIDDSPSLVTALDALLPRLAPDAIARSLTAARAIPYLVPRAISLERFAAVCEEPERSELISEARALAAQIAPDAISADDMAALLSRAALRTENLTDGVFASLAHAPNEYGMAEALVALAPALDAEQLALALERALGLAAGADRIRALVALAPRLDAAQRTVAVDAGIDAIPTIANEFTLGPALAALASVLEPERTGQLLGAAQAIEDDEARPRALAELGEYAPAELTDGLIAAADTIRERWPRLDTVAALAPRLTDSQLAAALAACEMGLPAVERASSLAAIIALVSPERRANVAGIALDAARAITAEPVTKARTIAALAAELDRTTLSEALDETARVDDPARRIEAITTLAPGLPDDLRAKAISAALAAAATIAGTTERATALVALAAAVEPADRHAVAGSALDAVRSFDGVPEHDGGRRIAALVALPELVGDEALPDVLALARRASDPRTRAHALGAVAGRLSGEARTAVVSEALAALPELDRGFVLDQVLEALAPVIPPALAPQALAAARTIDDARLRASSLAVLSDCVAPEERAALVTEAFDVVRAAPGMHGHGHLLQQIAPRLPATLVPEGLEAARAIGSDMGRAEALTALIPRLDGDERGAAVQEALAAAETIDHGGWSAHALRALIPLLRDSGWSTAINVALSLEHEYTRARELAGLAEGIAALDPKASRPLISRLLHGLSTTTLTSVLDQAHALARIVALANTPSAADALADAVIDADGWIAPQAARTERTRPSG